jgi:hypothetical protein
VLLAELPTFERIARVAKPVSPQQALEAAEQCIVDFLEAYKRDCTMLVLDLAVQSLRDDALPKVRAARRSLAAQPIQEAHNGRSNH